MAEEKTIYDLDLHEQLTLLTNPRNTEVLKVPGGWIYYRKDGGMITSTFVPYKDQQESKYNNPDEEVHI